jgi:hypothetical protein
MGKICIIIGGIIVLSLSAQASTPYTPRWDDGYRAYQDIAPEYLEVEIQEVKKRNTNTLWFASSNRDIYIQAKVLNVYRSEAGLRPGHLIPILYKRKVAAGLSIGDQPVPPPVGEVVPAFLKYEGNGVFAPAALHHTFNSLAPEQKAEYDRKLAQDAEPALQETLPLDEFDQDEFNQDMPEATLDQDIPPVEVVEPVDIPSSGEVVLLENTPAVVEVGPNPSVENPVLVEPIVLDPAATAVAPPAPEPALPTTETVTKPVDPAPAPADPGPGFKGILTLEDDSPSQVQLVQATESPAPMLEVSGPEAPSIDMHEADVPLVVPMDTSIAEPGTDSTALVMETEPVIMEVDSSSTPLVEEFITPIVTAEPATLTEPIMEVVPTVSGPSITDFESTAFSPSLAVENSADTTDFDNEAVVPSPIITANEDPIEITAPDVSATSVADSLEPVEVPSQPMSTMTETEREPIRRYADIFTQVRNAERLITASQYNEALPKLQKVLEDIKSLREAYPNFQPFMVEYRQRTTERAIQAISARAAENTEIPETPE